MRGPFGALLWSLVGVTGGLGWALVSAGPAEEAAEPVAEAATVSPSPTPSPDPPQALPATTPTPEPDPEPEPTPAVQGLLTFRGNATRSYYGEGPVPTDPEVAWRYPERAMCAESVDGGEARIWCGTGWTGQPVVFERDRTTWVVFGAYDRNVHFLDAHTGEQILPPFGTGDLVKGSATMDPDGFPLVYIGSRDGYYRVLAIDGDEARELWALWAHDVSPTMWNDDWDGAGLIRDDYLYIGGENSQFHIVKLNRGYERGGRVTVDPELVFNTPGWDDQLLRDIGDRNVSIEGSVTLVGDVVYFANSGGLVQGWDVSGLEHGREPRRVLRFWTGDDTDATIVADDEGMLYVASEWQRRTARGREVGQVMKLDPSRPADPLVWSVHDRDTTVAGAWATPALHRDVLYVPTHAGRLLAIDRADGEVRWSKRLPGPTWSSPVVVDDVLIQGDCSGTLRAYDVSDTSVEPDELWALRIGGCIESTPAVWRGGVYVGTRTGLFVALR
jgi:outer membrane protein assembly factor BamB